jgi:outer membrane biosynthesis protein TonB
MAKPVALRTSLIWHDEVMGDVVCERPREITIGPFDGATFITPKIGLPDKFAIVRPGSRGHVLTLGEHMRGTVCIGGVEHDVAALVRASETPGFYASAIGGLDWGVIELDPEGAYRLFFAFVPLEEEVPTLPRPVLIAGVTGYALSAAVLSIVWGLDGFSIDEAIFRGLGLATLALGAAALVRWVLRQDGESRASLAFSMLLHAAILVATFRLASADADVWPGPRDLTASYIVSRIESSPPVPASTAVAAAPREPTVRGLSPKMPSAQPFKEPPPPKRQQPHIQNKQPGQNEQKSPHDDTDPGKTPPKGEVKPRAVPAVVGAIAGIAVPDAHRSVDRLAAAGGDGGHGGPAGGDGAPTTRGGGDGKHPAGHFHAGDPSGKLETGPMRAPSMCAGAHCGTAPVGVTPIDDHRDREGTSLTALDIDRVIRNASRLLTKCYQKEVNRNPNLGGTVQIRFWVKADGSVESTRITDNTKGSNAVAACVAQRIGFLKFPAKGRAVVNYPFVFQIQ